MNPALENIYRLRIFVEVANSLNFSSAARRLFLTQPAVSQHIGVLERALGTPLFTHRRRQIALTEAGAALAAQARVLIAAAEAAEAALAGQGVTAGAPLRIAGSLGWEYILSFPLAKFRVEHADVRIQAAFRPAPETHEALTAQRVSLAFLMGDPLDTRFETRKVGDCEVILVAPPRHPLLKQCPIAVQALHGIDFISFGQEPWRHFGDRDLRRLGVRPHYVAELASTEAIKRAVQAGVGVSMLLAPAVEEELARNQLVRIPLSGLRITQPLFTSRARDIPLSRVHQSFLSLVSEYVGTLTR